MPCADYLREKDGANLKSTRYFQENMEKAKMEILKNTGHIVNEENPGKKADWQSFANLLIKTKNLYACSAKSI